VLYATPEHDADNLYMPELPLPSLIDLRLWDAARWIGTAYGSASSLPPYIGLIFLSSGPGRSIFEGWRRTLGPKDLENALRIAIVEGPHPQAGPGYSITVGADPAVILARAEQAGLDVPDPVQTPRKANRHDPSPHLKKFKADVAKHGRFMLCPVFMTPHGPVQDLDLGIEKTKVLFRDIQDVTKRDVDGVIFG
jgi:hypothetical protein